MLLKRLLGDFASGGLKGTNQSLGSLGSGDGERSNGFSEIFAIGLRDTQEPETHKGGDERLTNLKEKFKHIARRPSSLDQIGANREGD